MAEQKPEERAPRDGVTREEVAALRRQLAETSQIAEMAMNELGALKEATGGISILAPEEVPVYEMAQPWYSPDCVYYPAGTQVEDITGSIVPNEHMIPLNEAAEARMVAYLSDLPTQGTPAHDLIIQAAMELRPREGDDPKEIAAYHGRVLQRAKELQFRQEGRMAPEPGDRPRVPVKLPQRPGRVPIMGGARIHQIDAEDRFAGDFRARFMPGNTAARPAAATRMRAPAQSAAEKSAPVFGGVASRPIAAPGA